MQCAAHCCFYHISCLRYVIHSLLLGSAISMSISNTASWFMTILYFSFDILASSVVSLISDSTTRGASACIYGTVTRLMSCLKISWIVCRHFTRIYRYRFAIQVVQSRVSAVCSLRMWILVFKWWLVCVVRGREREQEKEKSEIIDFRYYYREREAWAWKRFAESATVSQPSKYWQQNQFKDLCAQTLCAYNFVFAL